jgi:nucleoside-diphosphate-sugar epimerase
MSILVTGGTGFLGGPFLQSLRAKGVHDVKVLVRSQQKSEAVHQLGFEPVSGDLLRADRLPDALRGVDTVFHLAAALWGSPADIWLHTVVGSKNLLEAAQAAGGVRRIVLVSSFSVYGVTAMKRRALIDEDAPLEAHPERRDAYAFAKSRQERLFQEYSAKHGFELVVTRPGVIYGPGGGRFSTRIGLPLPGMFLFVGHGNFLPLTFVRNCADAIALAGLRGKPGEILNVVDDGLPTCREYLKLYRKNVEPVRYIPIPYAAAKALGGMLEWYCRYSQGQLPAVLTPYKVESLWKPTRFTNKKLKALGWKPLVTTEAGLNETFECFRNTPVKAH